jgi:hypothetical protein
MHESDLPNLVEAVGTSGQTAPEMETQFSEQDL